jgi:hypothetical protein
MCHSLHDVVPIPPGRHRTDIDEHTFPSLAASLRANHGSGSLAQDRRDGALMGDHTRHALESLRNEPTGLSRQMVKSTRRHHFRTGQILFVTQCPFVPQEAIHTKPPPGGRNGHF